MASWQEAGAFRPMGRRMALKALGGVSAAALLASCGRTPTLAPVAPGVSINEGPRFTGPLQDVHLRLRASPSAAQIVPGLETSVWRFEAEVLSGDPAHLEEHPAGFLGPTLHLRQGQRVRITFENDLPQESIVHWHGLVVPEDQDGAPSYAVDPGERYEYDFVVANRPGTFWYHPHPHHHTGEQVYRGLAGLLIVHGEGEVLPQGAKDLAVVLQDRTLGFDGQLRYVQRQSDRMMGFVGETLIANGVVGPEIPVTRSAHRIRILNGANARTQHLRLADDSPLHVIATDGCLLPETVIAPSVVLTPAQRVDLWVDFSRAMPGDRIELLSAEVMAGMGGMGGGMGGGGSGMGGMGGTSGSTGGGLSHQLALTFVVMDSQAQPSTAPRALGGSIDLDPRVAVNRSHPKEFVLSTRQGTHWINDRQWEGRISSELETVAFGTTEIWEFVNRSGMIHPMHLHGEAFHVLERTWEAGSDISRESWERIADSIIDVGLIDTVLVWPGQRVRFVVRFDKHRGYFPYHCHILEHEDDGMMRKFHVV